MIGTTPASIRERIEALAAGDGEYHLVCARTGLRPVPATTLSFESRESARSAVRATEQYRAALRRYDPNLPHHDVIVCQGSGTSCPPRRGRSDSVRTTVESGSRGLVDFCHRVTAATFEALSDADHDGVESAAMDTYLSLAESVHDRDELCLCLLESVAAELDRRLSPERQERVPRAAAARLDPVDGAGAPVVETFERLLDRGLVGQFTRPPASVDVDAGTRSVAVEFGEYALDPWNGRLSVLPVVVELYGRTTGRSRWRLRAVSVGDGWRVTCTHGETTEPTGLARVSVRQEG